MNNSRTVDNSFLYFSKYFGSLIAFGILYEIYSFSFMASVGGGLFVFFVFNFINNVSNKIEIRDIIILLSLLQWVIGPMLAYRYVPDIYVYGMSVSEKKYMGYIVPGTIAFIVGLYFPLFYSTKVTRESLINAGSELKLSCPNLDIMLIFAGISAMFISSYVPASLRYFVSLAEFLRFVGLFYVLVSDRGNKWLYILLVIGSLVLRGFARGMFHDILLWGVLIFLIIAVMQKFSNKKKIICILSIVCFAFAIQLAKREMRAKIWIADKNNVIHVQKANTFLVLLKVAYDKLFIREQIITKEEMLLMITRINQGWIIANIMNHVPSVEPFANGETINQSIKDSILPRFLFDKKSKAGGHDYYQRFTGRFINMATSMGLSIIGEAYANYGMDGKYFMLAFGFMFNVILLFFYSLAKKQPLVLFWIPIVFLYSVKAETGLFTVLNHMVKSTFFVLSALIAINFLYPSLNRVVKPLTNKSK